MASTAKEKGPQRANASSLVSHTLTQGNEIMQTHNTAPADGATQSYQFTLSKEKLRALGPNQFHTLYDAFTLAGEALHGIKIQPRCQQENNDYLLNDAGEILEEMTEFFHSCANMVVQASSEVIPQSWVDTERLAWLQLPHEAEMSESLVAFAVLASQLVAKAHDAALDERRPAGRAAA